MIHRPTTSRRDFLRLGLAAGPASLVAACGWDGGAFLEPKLRAFGRLNDWAPHLTGTWQRPTGAPVKPLSVGRPARLPRGPRKARRRGGGL